MRFLGAEMDIVLPYPEVRWWALGGVIAIVVASFAIVRVVWRVARGAEAGSHPGRR
jgi:hypothetical protein